ncbi:MAG TPA: PEGA domain-containing protein [Polyangiaceae bacterium]
MQGRFAIVLCAALSALGAVTFFSRRSSAQSCPYGIDPRTKVCRERPFETIPVAPSIRIDSSPAGARVYDDGRYIGTTPLTFASPVRGTHALRFEREGFETVALSAELPSNGPGRPVFANLGKVPPVLLDRAPGCADPQPRHITVTTELGDQIFAWASATDSSPIAQPLALSRGVHHLSIRAEGFEPIQERSLTVPVSEPLELCFEPYPGTLKIVTPGFTGVPVQIQREGGPSSTVVTSPGSHDFPPGRYLLNVEAFRGDASAQVQVMPGETTEARLSLWSEGSPKYPDDANADALREECESGRVLDACAASGFIYLHRSKPNLPRAIAMYTRACASGDDKGCLALHYILKSGTASIRMQGFPSLGELCKRKVEAACTYQYVDPRSPVDPTVWSKPRSREVFRSLVSVGLGVGVTNQYPVSATAGFGLRILVTNYLSLQLELLGLDYATVESKSFDGAVKRLHLIGNHFGVGPVFHPWGTNEVTFRVCYEQSTYFNESASSPGILIAAGMPGGPYSSTHQVELGALAARLPVYYLEALNPRDGKSTEFLSSGWRGLIYVGYSWLAVP